MKKKKNYYLINLILLTILPLAFVSSAKAQSTSISNPTAFPSNEITGKGPSAETNYYYSFTGGPGEVTIGLSIQAKQYSTFARLEVLNAAHKTLATHNMNAATSTGTAQALKKVSLGEKQTVLIKLTLDGNLAEYKITLGGAAELGNPSAETNSTTPSPETTSSGEVTQNQTAADTISPTTGGGNKIFNIDFSKFKLGQFVNLPKTGTLVIQMKDGSTQEIDLKKVKSLMVKP